MTRSSRTAEWFVDELTIRADALRSASRGFRKSNDNYNKAIITLSLVQGGLSLLEDGGPKTLIQLMLALASTLVATFQRYHDFPQRIQVIESARHVVETTMLALKNLNNGELEMSDLQLYNTAIIDFESSLSADERRTELKVSRAKHVYENKNHGKWRKTLVDEKDMSDSVKVEDKSVVSGIIPYQEYMAGMKWRHVAEEGDYAYILPANIPSRVRYGCDDKWVHGIIHGPIVVSNQLFNVDPCPGMKKSLQMHCPDDKTSFYEQRVRSVFNVSGHDISGVDATDEFINVMNKMKGKPTHKREVTHGTKHITPSSGGIGELGNMRRVVSEETEASQEVKTSSDSESFEGEGGTSLSLESKDTGGLRRLFGFRGGGQI